MFSKALTSLNANALCMTCCKRGTSRHGSAKMASSEGTFRLQSDFQAARFRVENRTKAEALEMMVTSPCVPKPNLKRFYENKTLMIVGCTGFIGKVLLEKILRSLPNVRRIYLLIRARDAEGAKARLLSEVLCADLFSPLREKHGRRFLDFVEEKLLAVAGDISVGDNLGITDDATRDRIIEEVEVILNNSAATKFNERYDVAFGVNAKGPLHILRFAKRCPNLQNLLHVSTAYVCGRVQGLIKENPLQMEMDIFDMEEELRVIDQALSSGLNGRKKINNLQALGLERAEAFGWPNTYTFTKSMGEMVLTKMGQGSPIVILRPTIVESTFSEPFPGWIESIRTLNAIILPYAKGMLPMLLASPDTVLDVVPADLVVKAMLAAMVENYGEQKLQIYHVASSVENPLPFSQFADNLYTYFKVNPFRDGKGKAIHVDRMRLYESMHSFYSSMIPTASVVLEKKKWYRTKFLAELYKPYLIFPGRFDSLRMQRMMQNLSEEDVKDFNFQVKDIDWTRYFTDIHIPGLLKYAINK